LRLDGRLSAGTVVDEQVSAVDVLPTVLELAGVPLPDGLAGRSLVAGLKGGGAFPDEAWSEEGTGGSRQRALRRAGWKRIEGAALEECYDLVHDPLERTPSPAPPEDLRQAFAEFERRFPPRATSEIELDPATLELLRALGYVE
jgi:arylsulfatase A-like enzyme